MKVLTKISDTLEKISCWVLIVLMAAMSIVVFIQVVFRWIHASLPWSEEFARYSMVFLTYLGASVGIKRKSLVAIEAVVVLLPKKVQRVIEVLIYLIVLAASGVVLYFGVLLCQKTISQVSPAMHVPMGLMYGALVLGFSLIVVHSVINITKTVTEKEGVENV